MGDERGLLIVEISADTFRCGCSVVVPTDAVEAFNEGDHEGGLKYLKKVHGAEFTMVDGLLEAACQGGDKGLRRDDASHVDCAPFTVMP